MSDPKRAFEEFLKQSNHFADALNSHRRATADVVAGVCELLIEVGGVSQAQMLAKLRGMEQINSHSPSDDSGRRLLCQMVKDRLTAPPRR